MSRTCFDTSLTNDPHFDGLKPRLVKALMKMISRLAETRDGEYTDLEWRQHLHIGLKVWDPFAESLIEWKWFSRDDKGNLCRTGILAAPAAFEQSPTFHESDSEWNNSANRKRLDRFRNAVLAALTEHDLPENVLSEPSKKGQMAPQKRTNGVNRAEKKDISATKKGQSTPEKPENVPDSAPPSHAPASAHPPARVKVSQNGLDGIDKIRLDEEIRVLESNPIQSESNPVPSEPRAREKCAAVGRAGTFDVLSKEFPPDLVFEVIAQSHNYLLEKGEVKTGARMIAYCRSGCVKLQEERAALVQLPLDGMLHGAVPGGAMNAPPADDGKSAIQRHAEQMLPSIAAMRANLGM